MCGKNSTKKLILETKGYCNKARSIIKVKLESMEKV